MLGKPDAFLRQAINVWSVQMRVSIARKIIPAELVKHDKKNVFGFAHSAQPIVRLNICIVFCKIAPPKAFSLLEAIKQLKVNQIEFLQMV